MKMSKYFYACLLSIVLISMLVISCVKIPTDAPPLPEFKAKVRIINVAASLGAVDVSIGGVAMGSVGVGANGAYRTIDAGIKQVSIPSVTDTLIFATDMIGSVFVIDETQDPDETFLLSREWSLDDFTNPPMADTVAQVIVAHMAADTLDFSITGLVDHDGELVEEDVEWSCPDGGDERLMIVDVPAGENTLSVTEDETTVDINLDVTGGGSITVVIWGTIDDLQSLIVDNALE